MLSGKIILSDKHALQKLKKDKIDLQFQACVKNFVKFENSYGTLFQDFELPKIRKHWPNKLRKNRQTWDARQLTHNELLVLNLLA